MEAFVARRRKDASFSHKGKTKPIALYSNAVIFVCGLKPGCISVLFFYYYGRYRTEAQNTYT
jgi:hypothetical protein